MGKTRLISAFIFLILFSSIVSGRCFGDPIYTDGIGDGLPDEDMKFIWVSNNQTHLKFKAELTGIFNESAGSTIFAVISVSNATGDNLDVYDIKLDYIIHFQMLGGLQVKLLDLNNSTNDLEYASDFGMAYYILSNDNHTLEWGYKLKTYNQTGGVGFLNISINQTINLQFTASVIGTDFAPNLGEGWITYQLNGGVIPSAPILEWPEGPPGPTVPVNFDGVINLNWSDVGDAIQYFIYRDTANITSIDTLSPIAVTSTSNFIDYLTISDTYYYAVMAGNVFGNSSLSNCVYVVVILPVGEQIPLLFPIQPNPNTDGMVELNWTEVEDAAGYYVYRNSSYIYSSSGLIPIATVSCTNYTDNITMNGIYYYAIRAINGSSVGNCLSVTVMTPLTPPTIYKILLDPEDNDVVYLNWSIVNNAVIYYVYRDNSSINSTDFLNPIAILSGLNFTDQLPADGTYYYVVVASDGWVNSSISNCENITLETEISSEPIDFTIPIIVGVVLFVILLATVVSLLARRPSKEKRQALKKIKQDLKELSV